jgi:riboflavin synthase
VFTGLVEAIGEIRGLHRTGPGSRIEIAVQWPNGEAPSRGDSIAVDGACLTALETTSDWFSAELSPETLDRTLLGSLRTADRVNLERALRLGDRLGGHFVQGHVDGIIRVLSIRDEGRFARWRLSLPREHAREVVLKGSVAVHGVSLTVAATGGDWFEVSLIPATLETTTLPARRSGSRVHLETDVLAKYVGGRLGLRPKSAVEELFAPGDPGA